MYGNFSELLHDATNSIQESRKLLRELYVKIQEGHLDEFIPRMKEIDKILLSGLDSFDEKKDGIDVQGNKCKPDWVSDSV
jgi:hypothetical protein